MKNILIISSSPRKKEIHKFCVSNSKKVQNQSVFKEAYGMGYSV